MQDKIEAIHRLRGAISTYAMYDNQKRYDVEAEILTWMASGLDLNEVAASYEEKTAAKAREVVEWHARMAELTLADPLSVYENGVYRSSGWTGRQ